MKALVTGGAGFIGSHLAEALTAEGAEVTVLDDLSTGRAANLASLEGRAGFRLVVGSVRDRALVGACVAGSEVVYHLASAVGVKLIIDEPVRTIQTIVEGTDNVLDAAREHGRRVLITSSSEVYGKAERLPFSESDDCVLGPSTTRRWAYACAKMLDEFLALAHWHESRLPVVCVRLFNTVGPRQTGRYGMVLPRLARQAVRGEAITVYGDGEQTRCFCHVGDAVRGLMGLMACEAAAGRVVNVGGEGQVSINELAARVKRLAGSSSPIVHVPYEQAYVDGFEDMRRREPNLALARELTGYRARHDLDDIIRTVLADVRPGTERDGSESP